MKPIFIILFFYFSLIAHAIQIPTTSSRAILLKPAPTAKELPAEYIAGVNEPTKDNMAQIQKLIVYSEQILSRCKKLDLFCVRQRPTKTAFGNGTIDFVFRTISDTHVQAKISCNKAGPMFADNCLTEIAILDGPEGREISFRTEMSGTDEPVFISIMLSDVFIRINTTPNANPVSGEVFKERNVWATAVVIAKRFAESAAFADILPFWLLMSRTVSLPEFTDIDKWKQIL